MANEPIVPKQPEANAKIAKAFKRAGIKVEQPKQGGKK